MALSSIRLQIDLLFLLRLISMFCMSIKINTKRLLYYTKIPIKISRRNTLQNQTQRAEITKQQLCIHSYNAHQLQTISYIFKHMASNQQYEEDNIDGQQKNTKEVLIRNSDMQPEQQCAIVGISNSAIEQVADLQGIFQTQKYSKIAGIIKKQLDIKFGSGWFVITGKNFGTYVTHEQGTFIHFSFDDLHICAFRAR